eukprot:PhM_4_TR5378/c1_g1_i1/m.90685/K10133/TP53I3; tumor protein p53-inducible protein 3
MRAVLPIKGGRELLRLGEVPKPTLSRHNDVIVKVMAAGVNRADILQRQGKYPPPNGVTDVLGLEVSGIVESVADGVTLWKPGDKVMALLSGGGCAEFVSCHEAHLLRVPRGMSMPEAAAIPEAFLTAYQSLYLEHGRGGIKCVDVALIHSGAGGVGSAAIQICRSVGAIPITTCSASKESFCTKLGAVVIPVDRSQKDGNLFSNKLLEIAKDGVNFILDPNFGAYLNENIECLSMDGTIVVLAFLGGPSVKNFNGLTLMKKRGALAFTTLRNRSDDYRGELVRRFGLFSRQKFEKGTLTPLVHCTLPMADIKTAHEIIETNAVQGKVVLTWD